MNAMTLQGAALVLMLLGLPLTSWGTTSGQTWLAAAGLGVVALGGLVTPVLHFTDQDDDEDAGDDEHDEDHAADDTTEEDEAR